MRLVLTATAACLLTALPALAGDREDCLAGIARLKTDIASRPAAGERMAMERALRRAESRAREREFDDCAGIVRAGTPAGSTADDDQDVAETEDMFGFTKGTSITEKGKFELSTEAEGAFGKRLGRYRAGEIGASVGFAPADRFSIELGAAGNIWSIRDVPGMDNRNGGGFGGFSAELKWQAIRRGPDSPIGMTLIAEPAWGFRDADSGERGRGLGLGLRVALDAELVPGRLFGGLNLIYELDKFRPRGRQLLNGEGEPLEGFATGLCLPDADADSRETCIGAAHRKASERSSQIGVSGALSYQLSQNLFAGGELRYLRAYSGLGLNHYEGQAVFLGPTLYAKLSERVSLSAAFSSQVAGKSKGSPGRSFDLDNFSRHQARLKLSYEF